MTIQLTHDFFDQICRHGEKSYPEEGAGLIIGLDEKGVKSVYHLLVFDNAREENARHNRYLLTPHDFLLGEQKAADMGLEIIGVFHSHPDHPDQPSEYDREWAMPSLSYIITSIQLGKAVSSRSWLLNDDRSGFDEEKIIISESADDFLIGMNNRQKKQTEG